MKSYANWPKMDFDLNCILFLFLIFFIEAFELDCINTSPPNNPSFWKDTSTLWFIWEVCDFTYLGIIHDWDHWSICPWNEVNFKGSGARLTPQNMQTCPRSVPKMALKKVSREFLNQSAGHRKHHCFPSTQFCFSFFWYSKNGKSRIFQIMLLLQFWSNRLQTKCKEVLLVMVINPETQEKIISN